METNNKSAVTQLRPTRKSVVALTLLLLEGEVEPVGEVVGKYVILSFTKNRNKHYLSYHLGCDPPPFPKEENRDRIDFLVTPM